MLTLTCPSCHKVLKGPEALAGKKVKCPACRHLIAVPGVGAPPQEHAHLPIQLPAVPEMAALSHENAHSPLQLPPAADLPLLPPSIEPLQDEEEPALPPLSKPDAAESVAGGHDVSLPEFLSASAPTAPIVLPPVVEGPAQPVTFLPAPAPAAEPPATVEARGTYFAPAGYTASDPRVVPFMAPGLRHRLGRSSGLPA